MGINIYETATMLEALRQTPPVHTFLRDTFFNNPKFAKTEKALIDIIKGGVSAAPFVAPRVNGVLETRRGYTTNEITTPRVAPKRVLTGEDLEKRQPGDNTYTTKSPDQIAAEMLMQDLIEMDQEITLSEEWLCAKVLLGSSFDITEYDESGKEAGTFNVDFGFTNKISVATAKKWTAEGVNPIEQIEEWIEKNILTKSSATPDIILLDPDAGKTFANNSFVKEIIQLRAQAGSFAEAQYKGRGVTSYGRFTKYGIEVVSYSNIVKANGVAEQLLPKGTCIIAQSGSGNITYGAITQKENGKWVKYMEKRVPKYSVDDEKEIDTERLASRPLPWMPDVDSYVVATGVC
ncbi:major capsid protein [Niameybacter massiliensis]|uniref:Major capsid protein n=1 Tax=Holtiella tumoricola TaxID=3018743 RepID=A0AA42DN88_9FIRM|nr:MULTISPECIES: major capsid protein [Lachnospirales]MDA3732382.1 major capsid protein [Holtiella tumoricola]